MEGRVLVLVLVANQEATPKVDVPSPTLNAPHICTSLFTTPTLLRTYLCTSVLCSVEPFPSSTPPPPRPSLVPLIQLLSFLLSLLHFYIRSGDCSSGVHLNMRFLLPLVAVWTCKLFVLQPSQCFP